MDDGAARLRALEDIEGIKATCIEYGRMLDAKDFRGYAALFTGDGLWGGEAFGTFRGREAIERFVTETFGQSAPCVHVMSNFRVSVEGDGATAWSRWTLIEARGGSPALIYAGHYDDELRRTAEGWRFARRLVSVDIP